MLILNDHHNVIFLTKINTELKSSHGSQWELHNTPGLLTTLVVIVSKVRCIQTCLDELRPAADVEAWKEIVVEIRSDYLNL